MIDMECELIARYQAGDDTAFAVLFRRYNNNVINFTRRFLPRGSNDAEDVAQEVWFKVSRSIHRYEPRVKFTSWLYIITRNTSINWCKKDNRLEALRGEFEENFHYSREPAPDSYLDVEYINQALATLPTRRKLFIDLLVTGCSYNEIAAIANCSSGTIKSGIHEARKFLKKVIT